MVKHGFKIEAVERGEKLVSEVGGFRTEWTFSHAGRGRWNVLDRHGRQVFSAKGGFDEVLRQFAGE